MAESTEHSYHPGRREYIQIGVILTFLTAIDVRLYYADPAPAVAIPALLALTALKFLLVVFWFMHLRFDTPLFRRLFFTGTILATIIYGIVAATFYFGGA